MTDQTTPTSVIRFSRELRCGTFEPDYDCDADLYKLHDGRYAVFFNGPTSPNFSSTRDVTSLCHKEWRNLGKAQGVVMSKELARDWVREKVCRLFEDPSAVLGSKTD